MKRKFKDELKASIQDYYEHRAVSKEVHWNKSDDLEAIAKASVRTRHNGIKSFEAIAGIFFFTWVDGVITAHDEDGWQEMKLFSEKFPNGLFG